MPRASFFGARKPKGMLAPDECIEGSSAVIKNAPSKEDMHYTLNTTLHPPFPAETEMITLGMGCFWCSENVFMGMKGMYSTHVGYAQGVSENPTYAEVCTGLTNHNEVVRLVYYPEQISLEEILAVFFERHDPTTLFRQGNDAGTQYRSGIYYYDEGQRDVAIKAKKDFQKALDSVEGAGAFGYVQTEVEPAKDFYYAELEHQQYDAKPSARQYCGLSPLGIPFPRES
eukprot:jgi/Bigna1/92162/estExt_fgenesh1_pm.C_50005